MKRTRTIFFMLLSFAVLLTGCGGSKTDPDTSSANDKQETYTPDEIRENNDIAKLLDHHSAVSYVSTYLDKDNNVISVIRRQYESKDGQLQMNATYEDGEGNVNYRDQAYADSTYEGASYGLAGDDMYMTLYTSKEEYEDIAGIGLLIDDESAEETVTENSMQDGYVIVTTRKEYQDEADLYDVVYYYIDPKTNDLLYMETNSYGTSDDTTVAQVKTEITYDDPMTFDVSPFEKITGGSDYCEVSLIVNPAQEDMATYWYPVAHGTNVSVASEGDVTLYGDEGLTQKLDSSDIDISGAACNIFVVSNK